MIYNNYIIRIEPFRSYFIKLFLDYFINIILVGTYGSFTINKYFPLWEIHLIKILWNRRSISLYLYYSMALPFIHF